MIVFLIDGQYALQLEIMIVVRAFTRLERPVLAPQYLIPSYAEVH